MPHRENYLEVLYQSYNPIRRSPSSITSSYCKKPIYKKQQFRSRKPPQNPRNLSTDLKPRKILAESHRLNFRKQKQLPIPEFPVFVTKSQFALQRKGSGKSLVVNTSKVKILRRIVKNKIRRKLCSVRAFCKGKCKMLNNKKPPVYKISKSNIKPVDSKSDDGYASRRKIPDDVESFHRIEKKVSSPRKLEVMNNLKAKQNLGNILGVLGPTPDETILAGLQTVIDMCSGVDQKPVEKSSIQELNTKKIMEWVKSEYMLLNEESKSSISELSIENISERKETLQGIEELVKRKFELENKGAQLKLENRSSTENSTSQHVSVYYPTQPSTFSNMDLDSLENSSEVLNAIRVSKSVHTKNDDRCAGGYLKSVLPKKNMCIQTICFCDKATQVVKTKENSVNKLLESIKSPSTTTTSKESESSSEISNSSSISLVEVVSMSKKLFKSPPDSSSKSTQFTPHVSLLSTKSTQITPQNSTHIANQITTSITNSECEDTDTSTESSDNSEESLFSDKVSTNYAVPTRPQVVNFFKVYTNNALLSPISSKSYIRHEKKLSKSSFSSTDSSALNSTTIDTASRVPLRAMNTSTTELELTVSKLDNTSSTSRIPFKSMFTSTTDLEPTVIKLNTASSTYYIPYKTMHTSTTELIPSTTKLNTSSSTHQIILKSSLTSTTELKPNTVSISTEFIPKQLSKSEQTIDSRRCLHAENFTFLPIIPELDILDQYVQTLTNVNCENLEQSSQTHPPPTSCSEYIQIPLRTESSIDLISKFTQTHKTPSPQQSTQTLLDTINTSMQANSSTLLVDKGIQTNIIFSQISTDSPSSKTKLSTTSSTSSTYEAITSGLSLEDESTSHICSSKSTEKIFKVDKASATIQVNSVTRISTGTHPFSRNAVSCQTSSSRLYETLKKCSAYKPPREQRKIQICNVKTCPMLREAMININGTPIINKIYNPATKKHSCSLPRIQMCTSNTCPMLKSASINISGNIKEKNSYPRYEFTEAVKTVIEKPKRKIRMCNAKNCKMLEEAVTNIVDWKPNNQGGDSLPSKSDFNSSGFCSGTNKKQRSIRQCNSNTCPKLQETVVNICSIEPEFNELFKGTSSKCDCSKALQDDFYITCEDVPKKPCATKIDCLCKSVEQVEKEQKDTKFNELQEIEDVKKTENKKLSVGKLVTSNDEVLKVDSQESKVLKESKNAREFIKTIESKKNIDSKKSDILERFSESQNSIRSEVSTESKKSKDSIGSKQSRNLRLEIEGATTKEESQCKMVAVNKNNGNNF